MGDLASGVSPKVASQIMGHKTPEYQPGAARITLERYTHMLPASWSAPASCSTSSWSSEAPSPGIASKADERRI